MYRLRQPFTPAGRGGAALLVVIALLALFAAVGLAFVLYAQSQATAARTFREAEQEAEPDADPARLLSFFLGQLIYDVDDAAGPNSALRGHGLARNMYGWNRDNPGSNIIPFNGTGRLHTDPLTSLNPWQLDDYYLINYTRFPADKFRRDPERWAGLYTGGANPSYTYPDLNHLFLGAVNADGAVLAPSFYRAWTDPDDPNRYFGSLDPANPNWYDQSKPWLKYLVLRPRPADHPPLDGRPGFPPPKDVGGDVKNLPAGRGTTDPLTGKWGASDSIWLDLDHPVLVASGGRMFKPLFAPLIIDLDNRVNVNVHGNVRGTDPRTGRPAHASNQGWGKWEINPRHLSDNPAAPNNAARQEEWARLFLGDPAAPGTGRYGPDRKPNGPPGTGNRLPPLAPPHNYAQVDRDGANETGGFSPTDPPTLPGFGLPQSRSFPTFPAGFGNGSAAERTDHPGLFDVFRPRGDDRVFGIRNLHTLLNGRPNGSGVLASELGHLCPLNLGDPRVRGLITTHSFDVSRPGVTPWLFDRDDSSYQPPLLDPDRPPTGPAVPFPPLTLRRSSPVPARSDFRTPGGDPDSPLVDWRSADAALGRVDLNRFLPPYPHQGQGRDRAARRGAPLTGPADRFDGGDQAVWEQFLAAQAARQQLADDVYRRLLAVTGVAAAADPANPSDADLLPRRWLARLAANIVDFLDEDEVTTPFNFYTARDGGPGFDVGAVSNGNAELPRFWVFGTELPRVLLNEVLTEYEQPGPKPGRFPVNVWVELFNPLPADPLPPGVQPLDAQPVPLYVEAKGSSPGYAPYRLVVANTSPGGALLRRPGNNDNVLGAPDVARAGTTDADFANPVGTAGDPAPSAAPAVAPQGFFLLGPPGPDARGTIASPRVPGDTPWLKSPNLQYAVAFTPPDTWVPDYRRDGITVLLRRLANPHLPADPRAAVAGQANPAYNPYVTIDYLEAIPLNDATGPAAVCVSRGKRQPYAADPSQVSPQSPVAGSVTWHTLGRPNDPPAGGRCDWLVHLDRSPISPVELLHVSGYAPHQLTHRFLCPDARGGPVKPFNHLVPWFDQDNRLYRVFEFLEAHDPASGVSVGGRTPGKINLNTVWDPETFHALCDPQPGNSFTPADVDAVFARMASRRTPAGVPAPADRPFLGQAVGRFPGPTESTYPPGGGPLFPGGSGIEDTFLRSAAGEGDPSAPRLFQVPGAAHPYLEHQLLTKIANHLTTRSNVFAVWVTVGFFEVTGTDTRPVRLGDEIRRTDGRLIRHRMFAVVDRSALTVGVRCTTSRTAVPAPGRRAVTPAAMSGTLDGIPWAIGPGSVLVVDSGPKEETVVVTAVDPPSGPTTFTADFALPHAADFRITCPGNPGPQPTFSSRHPMYAQVVLYAILLD